MDDHQIEDRLRDAFASQVPEDLEERVLRAFSSQAVRRKRLLIPWKPALAVLAASFVLFANVSDRSREARLMGPELSQHQGAPAALLAMRQHQWESMLMRPLPAGTPSDFIQGKGVPQ